MIRHTLFYMVNFAVMKTNDKVKLVGELSCPDEILHITIHKKIILFKFALDLYPCSPFNGVDVKYRFDYDLYVVTIYVHHTSTLDEHRHVTKWAYRVSSFVNLTIIYKVGFYV